MSNNTKKPTIVKSPVANGSTDVAYAVGGVPDSSQRDSWTSVQSPSAQNQKKTDAAVSTSKYAIEAKKATDLANQKQAAAAATGVVNNTVASKAGVAASEAVKKANASNRNVILYGLLTFALVGAGIFYFIKRKKKKA